MEDQELCARLNQVSSALWWEGREQLPGREVIDQLRLALLDLAIQPPAEDERERLAALQAVYAQLNRLERLL